LSDEKVRKTSSQKKLKSPLFWCKKQLKMSLEKRLKKWGNKKPFLSMFLSMFFIADDKFINL